MASNVAYAMNPTWESEDIPDGDLLYMRLHRMYINNDGSVQVGAFRDHEGGMSTDWSKYSSPEQTQSRAKKPLENAIPIQEQRILLKQLKLPNN